MNCSSATPDQPLDLKAVETPTVLVVMEALQECQKLVPVSPKNSFNLRWLAWIRNKDLENMKRLELDVFALVSKKVHHHLQIALVRNVLCHDVEVGAVEKDFSEQLE